MELSKSQSECVHYAIGTFSRKQEWTPKQLYKSDPRIKSMFTNLGIDHALPIQRHVWPQMAQNAFPVICVSTKSTGKTYAHLIYMVVDCMKNNVPIDNAILIAFPKYIVICSSQRQVEAIELEIDKIKVAALGDHVTHQTRKNLPPRARIISISHEDDKLAVRCGESDILISTPAALIKCFNAGYLNFVHCDHVIFDDLDLTLQLHNHNVRELIKVYLIQTQEIEEKLACNSTHNDTDKVGSSVANDADAKLCRMLFFSQKWTSLVKQFICGVFVQRDLIFGSLLEAALYSNTRFEVETYNDTQSRLNKLVNIVELFRDQQSACRNQIEPKLASYQLKLVIICKFDNEAQTLSQQMSERGLKANFLPEDSALIVLKQTRSIDRVAIYVLSDRALDLILHALNDVTFIVHYSLPETIHAFDKRFNLMFKYINDTRDNLSTTILTPTRIQNQTLARDLYDVISRSTTSLKSTKLLMRDILNESAKNICWRWATTGLCRLDKVGKDDCFGSYCPDRHSLEGGLPEQFKLQNLSKTRWPTKGQLKITVTHIKSPNEFYFWFEAHRDIDTPQSKWRDLESTGRAFMSTLQTELNLLKKAPSSSVPIENIKRGKVFGVYFHDDVRVDRVMILEDPRIPIIEPNIPFDEYDPGSKYRSINGNAITPNKLASVRRIMAYSTQCEVLKIDYGTKVSVYLHNLIPLPESILSIQAQCHRGFLLGFKPANGDPFWSYKATKQFSEILSPDGLDEVCVWIRLNHQECFWFEEMISTRKLINLEANNRQIMKANLIQELKSMSYADEAKEPAFLRPSDKQKTKSKWHTDKSASMANYAFLRTDKVPLELFILQVTRKLSLMIRQTDFNKQLIELEEAMLTDYHSGKLVSLQYFDVNVYCLARIQETIDPEPTWSINRCQIRKVNEVYEGTEVVYDCHIFCLDHGDYFRINGADLFLTPDIYMTQLPFQAIHCELAELNQEILTDDNTQNRSKITELIYDSTRTQVNNLKPVKAQFNSNNQLYIYFPTDADSTRYKSLVREVKEQVGIDICLNREPFVREDLIVEPNYYDDEPKVAADTNHEFDPRINKDHIFATLIMSILTELIITDELRSCTTAAA